MTTQNVPPALTRPEYSCSRRAAACSAELGVAA